MNELTKSLLRHILFTAGTIAALVGLNSILPIIDFLLANLDGVWAAVMTIVGFVLSLFGFFKDSNRFTVRTARLR